MSRLIDADDLLQEFEKENVAHNRDIWHITGIKAFIENAPTAFDKEKVVEQLEQYANGKICNMHRNCPHKDNDNIACENCGALGAIDIVKKGGVE